MRNSWYIRCAGVESGPVLFEKIVELARSGGINPTDEVRRSDEQTWTSAAEVEGLFAAVAQEAGDPIFDDILDVAAADDGSHASGQRVGTLLENQTGYDPHHHSSTAKITRYFCRVQGKEAGPFTLSELQQRADDGLISAFDRVRNEDGKAWVPVQEIAEISFNAKPTTAAKSRTLPQTADAPPGERPRTSAESRVPSIESVIDDVLSEGSESPTSSPDPMPVKPAPKQQPAAAAPRTEARPDETKSRHAAMLASALAEASASPTQKPAKKEKRVARSGPKFEFQMPGGTWMMALIGVILLAGIMTWMRREGAPPVSGEAKVDGQPIPVGTISFHPISGTKGEPLTTPIVDGEFAAGQEDVLGEGKHSVRVVIGNPLGQPPAELSSVPAFAALNGAVFEKEIDTTSDDEGLFVFEFPAADARMQSESTGNTN